MNCADCDIEIKTLVLATRVVYYHAHQPQAPHAPMPPLVE